MATDLKDMPTITHRPDINTEAVDVLWADGTLAELMVDPMGGVAQITVSEIHPGSGDYETRAGGSFTWKDGTTAIILEEDGDEPGSYHYTISDLGLSEAVGWSVLAAYQAGTKD